MNKVSRWTGRLADTYAAWFRALADGTRVQVVSLLARGRVPADSQGDRRGRAGGPVDGVGHLRQLAAVGFVLAEDRGTSRLYRINDNCVTCFPTAADLVMGKPSPVPPVTPEPPEDDHGTSPPPR